MGVLVTGAGAAPVISAFICAALTIHFQQRLRDPRLDVGFAVEGTDHAVDNAAQVDIDIGLHGHVDVGAIVAHQAGEAIKGLAYGIEPRQRHLERALLFGLSDDLIDAVAQVKIGAAECLLRRQERQGRGAARRFFSDGVRRSELEAIGAVAIEIVSP
jgi:hypothetical protein